MTDVIGDWRRLWVAWREGETTGASARAQNRLMSRIGQSADLIAASAPLRAEVEELCGAAAAPEERVQAAVVRCRWDLDGAALTYTEVLIGLGRAVPRPMTMTDALDAPWGLARDAAFGLFNIDFPPRDGPAPVNDHTSDHTSEITGEITEVALAAADDVHALALNGGVDHAFHVVGDVFVDAESGLRALGAHDSADVLRDLARHLPPGTDLRAREAVLDAMDDDDVALLVDRYEAQSDLVSRLLDAAEPIA